MAAPPVVPAHSPQFDDLLSRVPARLEEGKGLCYLFENADEEALQLALGRMKAVTKLSTHQVNLESLFDERIMAVQGNLREVFDSAGEVPSILCFDHADAFFRHNEQQAKADEREEDALSPITYLFDRIDAFKGVVVLCLDSGAYLTSARPVADVVVTF